MRLRAAIEKIADLAGIWNSMELHFLPECQSFGRKSRRTCFRLRKKRQRKSAPEQQERKKASHDELDANSVARDDLLPKLLKQRRLRRKSATTNRRDAKTSTTFCVFLLTENFPALILQIQIRGTWKR